MNKKIVIATALVVSAGAVYLSGSGFSFDSLRSAILGDDCTSSQLQANKPEYDKSVADLAILEEYITLNACESDGQINTLGKNNFEIAACQRKLTLKASKKTFVDGYNSCQSSINAGPRILSGSVINDAGATDRTLIEQSEGEDMHLNESVYSLSLRAQGESYVRELVYELSLPVVSSDVGIKITKAEMSSTKSGTYACSQNLAEQADATKRVYLITCRATDGGYQMGVGDDNAPFTANLNLSVSTISATGEGSLKFISGKYSLLKAGGEEKALTRVTNITSGVLKYVMAFVDPRDLTVNLVAQSNTSSTVIPVRAEFNKLVDIASVSTDDFVLSNNVSASNLLCSNVADNENGLRTICTIELEPSDTSVGADITVDFAAGSAKDKTRGTPKTNAAATQKIIHYVYGAPTIMVGAPCATESTACSGTDNTPQLLVRAAVGDIPAGSVVSIYAGDACSGSPVHTTASTRDMPVIDLYEKVALEKNQTKQYVVKIGSSCSALGTGATKKASYTYTGETIAQVDRLECMNNTTFQYDKFSVGPYAANKISLCDLGDMVAPAKCSAWQGNGTFNPECLPTGQGTLNNPYRICTPEQLQELDNVPGKHFRLGQNIDLTNAQSWFGGKGFQPIGRNLHAGFWGSLDGNGFEIQNLKIDSPNDYIGLFGQANGASWPGFWVNNLKLNNTRIINPGNMSGSLAGYAGCAIISGVESTGINITGAQNMSGGLIGATYLETKVFYTNTQGSLTTADTMKTAAEGNGGIGGMIGRVPGSRLEIAHSGSTVNVYAKGGGIGGLVGHLYGSATNTLRISDVQVGGSVRAKAGSSSVGAVLGDASHVMVENSRAYPIGSNKVSVDGDNSVTIIGGFVGSAGNGSQFTNNETRYNITGEAGEYVGGFAGRMDNSTATQNRSVSNNIGLDSKGPRGKYVGGFIGVNYYSTMISNTTSTNISLSSRAATMYIGGFAGGVGAGEFTNNTATGVITLNHNGDYGVGGFAGYVDEYGGKKFVFTDNYTASPIEDEVGLYGTNPNYVGGFAGTITGKKVEGSGFSGNTFFNNKYKTCTGKSSLFVQTEGCEKLTAVK